MSCCQNKRLNNIQDGNIEPFRLPLAQNYDIEDQTYTNPASTYYAAPWPMDRTQYDANLQAKLNTSNIPDFLNYTSGNAPVMPFSQTSTPQKLSASKNRKSILKGNVNYSY